LWFSDPSRTAAQDLYSVLPTAALLIAALVPDAPLRRFIALRGLAIALLAATIWQYAEAFLTSVGPQPHPFAATVRGLVLLVALTLIARALLITRSERGRDNASVT
jgi:hypothetical protein